MEDMKDKTDYEYLKEMYDELSMEKDSIEKEIFDNQNSIKEIEVYIQSLFEKEDVDYEVFSPRNVQSVYKDKIDSQTDDKNKLINENAALSRKLSVIDKRLTSLDHVMNHMMKNDDVNQYTSHVSSVIIDIQEKERQRIARDLHDNTVQNLTHLIHKIELSSKFMDQDVIRAKMELIDINRNMKDIINDMRNIIFNLRPMEFDDIGLKATFEKYITEASFQSKIEMEYSIDDELTLGNELSDISMYHIVKECVNNAVKHSEAKHMVININNVNSEIHILIKDDGVGFDISHVNDKRHFGLSLLKESVSILNGTLDIDSVVNRGTIISICIPKMQ